MPREEVGEASWSRSSRAERLRRRGMSSTVTTRRRRTPASAHPSPTGTTIPSRVTQSPPQPSRTKGRKRARSADREDEKNAEHEAPTVVTSPPTEHASSEDSSVVSSPLCFPLFPREVIGVDSSGEEVLQPVSKMNSRLLDAYDKLSSKRDEKTEQQMKLVTLSVPASLSCLANQELIPIYESATKTVLKAAKVVMSLSSYVDGALLTRTSGFLINWDEERKIGTILTSALLIRSKSPPLDEWLSTGEYIPEAEVRVHLLDKDDSVVVAELLHYDKNYNLAIFKAGMDLSSELPSFSDVKSGQEVFVLGRGENLELNVDHGLVQYEGPTGYEHHYYMFINCALLKSKCGIGGPVIDLNGEVMGIIMKIPRMAFIPSIIKKWLHMWRKFDCVPRLHIGMKLSPIKFLDLIRVEMISRKCNVDSGLIVKEVSHGSIAEELGVRDGDIIESMNGECIITTVELENMLMRICENHLDQ